MCDTDIASRVTLFCEFASEELVEFCTEDTVGDELAFLADLSGHYAVVLCMLSKCVSKDPTTESYHTSKTNGQE